MSEMTRGASPMRSSTPNASRPLPASKQLKPCDWSIRTSERRTLGSSSTIRQLALPATIGGAPRESGMGDDNPRWEMDATNIHAHPEYMDRPAMSIGALPQAAD